MGNAETGQAWTESAGNINIASGKAVWASGTPAYCKVSHGISSGDYWVSVEVTLPPAGFAGIIVGANSGTGHYNAIVAKSDGVLEYHTYTGLLTSFDTGLLVETGDVIQGRIASTGQCDVYVNGVYTGSGFAMGARVYDDCGLYFSGSSGSPTLDEFIVRRPG